MSKYNVLFIVLCLACSSANQTDRIFDLTWQDDCNFWIEGGKDKTFLPAGISGACKKLTPHDYALVFDTVLNIDEICNQTYPGLLTFYLNIYIANDSSRIDLITRINSSQSWRNDAGLSIGCLTSKILNFL